MSEKVIIQYLGFEAKSLERVYVFSVRMAPDEPREFTLTISNEAFVSHRVSYQDAPNICSLKLHRELAIEGNHPMERNYRISDAELGDYRDSHSPKAAHGFYPRKAARQP